MEIVICKTVYECAAAEGHPNQLPVFDPKDPTTPTNAQPGSPEKLQVMIERAERGEHIHHEDDYVCRGPTGSGGLAIFGYGSVAPPWDFRTGVQR